MNNNKKKDKPLSPPKAKTQSKPKNQKRQISSVSSPQRDLAVQIPSSKACLHENNSEIYSKKKVKIAETQNQKGQGKQSRHNQMAHQLQQLQMQRALTMQVDINRESLSKIKNKSNICSICIENIIPQNEAHLSSCQHVFCINCVYPWAIKCCNQCPNCKQKFNQIITKDEQMKDKVIEVPDKVKGESDSEFWDRFCWLCDEDIDDQQEAIKCVECGDHIHFNCLLEEIVKIKRCQNAEEDSQASQISSINPFTNENIRKSLSNKNGANKKK